LLSTLPISRCATTFAVTPTPTTAPLPTTALVLVPAAEASDLVVYSDDAGVMTMIGPTGWTCHGMYGADGSGGLVIAPPGESVPADPDAGWHLAASSADQAIVGYETGASPVQGAALACPLFPAAAATNTSDLGRACPVTRPAQETVDQPASDEAGFEDPPGVAGDGIPSGGQDPANGVLLYLPRQNGASASLATCTLPAAKHVVCTAILNHFAALYG
jgi:hypothetical protein